MTEQNIIVLGASYSGLYITNYILKHVFPKLQENTEKYHVYLVNPSKEFFHVTSSPRAILSDDLIPPAQAFVNIPETFLTRYNASVFSFIEGTVTSLDITARTIHYKATQDDTSATVPYHALIIATGAKTASPLFSTTPHVNTLRSATRDFRSRLSTARSIVIAGSGPVGVETAGEIGEYLNGAAGWWQASPPAQKASVLIVTSSARVLEQLRADVSARAAAYLRRVGVDVRYNTRVVSATAPEEAADGGFLVTLATGEVLEADIYIPATGLAPNTSFVPAALLTKTGHVDTHAATLRVEGAGPRVYAIGDVASASPGGIMHIWDMVPVVASNLARDLRAAAAEKDALDTGRDRVFDKGGQITQIVPVGRGKGVGQIFGWWVPSLMVWWLKGRDYMVSKSKEYVLGTHFDKEVVWKFE